MKRKAAGIFGNSARDEYVDARAVERNSESLEIAFHDGSIQSFPVNAGESKISLEEIPEQFGAHVLKSRAGGGGVNSRLAVSRIEEDLGAQGEIRYLDANEPDGFIKSELPPSVRCLALRAVPRNYVFGSRDDKCIFRSPIDEAPGMLQRQFNDIDWCCQTRSVLLNGPKDEEPVEAILDRRSRNDFEVIFVLTPSLRADFLQRTVLARADVLIGAWDELQFLTGPAPVTLPGAAMSAARLRALAPGAEIHITMGKHGVLSMAAGSSDAAHIALDPTSAVFAAVQVLARTRPANLCGAGDAFAGGLLALRAFGWSLVSPGGVTGAHVRAARAGCASALSWIGFRSGLAVDSFVVHRVPAGAGAGLPWGYAA